MIPSSIRQCIGLNAVVIAVGFGVLGQLITFVPGAEASWYGFAAVAAAVGLLCPIWQVRLLAVVLLATFAWFAILGYQRGLQYEEQLWEDKVSASYEAAPQRH